MDFMRAGSLGFVGVCLTTGLFAGCAGGSTDTGSGGAPAGTGGAPIATGGTTGSGGAASGGATASGGAASGGATGSGGAGAGGLVNTGGTTNSGGAPASGGVTGSGGNASGGAPSCPEVPALTGGNEYCTNTKSNIGNGYGFEIWQEGPGSGCMTVHGQEGTFSAEWDGGDDYDFLARTGLDFNQTQTHQQIGNITAEFAETKTETGDGLTYIGIYGWTVDPLIEFYILDDWGAVKPGGFSSDGTPREEVGTLEADGEIYDVWKKERVNKPSIVGDATFWQYFSIRRTARQCGTISISKHFEEWEDMGLELGNFHEVKILLEAQFHAGSATFTTARVTAD